MKITKKSPTATLLTSLALVASLFMNSPVRASKDDRPIQTGIAERDHATQTALSLYAVDLNKLIREGRLNNV